MVKKKKIHWVVYTALKKAVTFLYNLKFSVDF